jgi:hypothetical protein
MQKHIASTWQPGFQSSPPFTHITAWPNGHMGLHIYDFLLLFGPVYSWWCFSFECLLGMLQCILNNHKFGLFIPLRLNLHYPIPGELQFTMLQLFSCAANLWHWLGRPDCPLVIQECKKLFNKWYSMSASDKEHQSLSGDGMFVQSLAFEDTAYSKGVSVLSDLL